MIKIKPKTPKSKTVKPHYKLVYSYMIGDADGYIDKEAKISLDNPYIEEYIAALNKLKPLPGWYAFTLEYRYLDKHCKEKHITQEECNLLKCVFSNWSYNDDPEIKVKFKEEKQDYLDEFAKGVDYQINNGPYLSLRNNTLLYVDEYGEEFETEII